MRLVKPPAKFSRLPPIQRAAMKRIDDPDHERKRMKSINLIDLQQLVGTGLGGTM